MPQTQLGVYVGNLPSGLTEFENETGVTADAVLAYTGGSSWSDANPGWQLSAGVGASGKPLLWSIPMYPENGGVSTLREVAAGQHNATYTDWAQQILASRSGDADPIYVRTAWELGGEWFPWTGDAAQDPAAFKAAFAQFADAFHDVSSRFKIVWDFVPDRPDYGVENYYPGDDAVDVISQDVYWQRLYQSQDPTVAFDQSVNGHERGLAWVADFAEAHGKPVAISEYGAAGSGDGSDAGVWLSLMEDWLDANNVAYATYWNGGPDSGYDAKMTSGRWPAARDDLSTLFNTPGDFAWDGTGGGGGPTDPPPNPTYDTPVSLQAGSGPDALVLKISEDEYQGSAEYTVTVDGQQVGGTFTAAADHASGQSDTLTLNGDWGPGAHDVVVTLTNDAWGGTAETDRNLYLDGATYNGTAVAGAVIGINAGDVPGEFSFTETGSGTGGGGGGTDPGAQIQAGSGPDALVLKITEQEYGSPAQYTVTVDGQQIGGIFTASADHGSGVQDTLTLNGDWGAGSHTVAVNYLNDEWGGSAAADKELFLESATYNGVAVSGAQFQLSNEWSPNTFQFTDAGSGGGGGTPTDPNVWPEPNPDPNPDYTYPLKNDWNGQGELVTAYQQFSGQWWAVEDIVNIGWQPGSDGGGGPTDPDIWAEPNPDPNPDYTYPLKTDWNGRGQLVTLYNQYGEPQGQWLSEDQIASLGWQPTNEQLGVA